MEGIEPGPNLGRIAAVHRSVVDIAFAGGMLPAINDVVAIERDLGPPLVAEVPISSTLALILGRSGSGLVPR